MEWIYWMLECGWCLRFLLICFMIMIVNNLCFVIYWCILVDIRYWYLLYFSNFVDCWKDIVICNFLDFVKYWFESGFFCCSGDCGSFVLLVFYGGVCCYCICSCIFLYCGMLYYSGCKICVWNSGNLVIEN